jgi:hypothetical protein
MGPHPELGVGATMRVDVIGTAQLLTAEDPTSLPGAHGSTLAR